MKAKITRQRKWALRNIERVNAYRRAYAKRNRAKMNQYNRKWYAKAQRNAETQHNAEKSGKGLANSVK